MSHQQQMSQAPCGWHMQLADKIADYMQSQFWEEALTGQCTLPDISIPLPLTQETASSLQYDEIMEATAVLDGNGNIKLWYLPAGDSHSSQRQIWYSLSRMAVPLKDSLKHSGNHGWWTDMVLFCQMVDLKGSIDLSPGWYQQGHGVRDASLLSLYFGDVQTAAQLPP
ncbi:hypothetical protein F5141DRAFT_1062967 [Pisolithus sp. B1]|nr:hypothetical protein F5141DRAFT_1062967 [Pisolithus sp. B1]